MVQFILIVLMCTASSYSLAGESRGKEFKMPDFSKLSKSFKKRENAEKSSATCTDETGKEYISGQKDFETCFAKYEAQVRRQEAKARVERNSEYNQSRQGAPKIGVGKSFKIK